METTNFTGNFTVPADFTKPSKQYKMQAWVAMAGLGLFILSYLLLVYWFSTSSIHLFSAAFSGGENPVFTFIGAVVSGFIAVFLLKALFFIKRTTVTDDVEITEKQEPRLVAFIYAIADALGAPRPHKIYLSSQVNAYVFYDLSVLNFLIPTKKNLTIGLGLVNSLTKDEFKAVLAHEFGHFAQKTMAVGKYVYIAHQVAAHIVGKRDGFDAFLRTLSSLDLRIAWIGWIVSILVWAIRSLMETLFLIVVLAERALSREMEFQADLVAVSHTGSDAIVNSLYRLQASDDSFDRTLSFAVEEWHEGREISNLFPIHKFLLSKIGKILNDPNYSEPPYKANNASSRIFKKNIANPTKMWATHPPSFEREENAKRTYIYMPISNESSWTLFTNAESMQLELTKKFFAQFKEGTDKPEKTPVVVSEEESIEKLEKVYDKAYYNPLFGGFYLTYSIARECNHIEELLTAPLPSLNTDKIIEDLYPSTLKYDIEAHTGKQEELTLLKGIYDKSLEAGGGKIMHDGREIKRKDLPAIIERLTKEVEDYQKEFLYLNKKIRTLHYTLANQSSSSCGLYYKGLLKLIHYCEHSIADLSDVRGQLRNTLNIVLADGKVSSSELTRLVRDANEVYYVLDKLFKDTTVVQFDSEIQKRLNAPTYASMMEEFKLNLATESSINGWLNVIDGWINLPLDRLEKIRQAALEELIVLEGQLVKAYKDGTSLPAFPEASVVPDSYALLLVGKERKLKSELSLWERFYIADGMAASIARFAAAASILIGVLYLGHFVTKSEVVVYNGLSVPVRTRINGESVKILPESYASVSIPNEDPIEIVTMNFDGDTIEYFTESKDGDNQKYVYNVAGATAIVDYQIIYGTYDGFNEQKDLVQKNMGMNRWFVTKADFIFEEAPSQVSLPKGSSYDIKNALHAYKDLNPSDLMYYCRDGKDSLNCISAHVLWDNVNSANCIYWLSLANILPQGKELFINRLKKYPGDLTTLRFMQDIRIEADRAKEIETSRRQWETNQADSNAYYFMVRAMPDGEAQNNAFIEGCKRWPSHGWLNYAGGLAYATDENWDAAQKAFLTSSKAVPTMENTISMCMARIYRVVHLKDSIGNDRYPIQNKEVDYFKELELGNAEDTTRQSYYLLSKGNLQKSFQYGNGNIFVKPVLTRLIAASDGATETDIRQLYKLEPTEGVSGGSLIATIGVMMKDGKSYEKYQEMLRNEFGEDGPKFLELISSLRKNSTPAQLESTIKSMTLYSKGYGYSLAVIYLENKCPNEWRWKANRLLFATERPYFSTSI